jgi:hypothetical protein
MAGIPAKVSDIQAGFSCVGLGYDLGMTQLQTTASHAPSGALDVVAFVSVLT